VTDAGLDIDTPDSLVDITGLAHALRWPVDVEAWVYRFRLEPILAVEMKVCREFGISHSHFLGGPAVWTDDDRAKALAYVLHEGQRCSDCGIHPIEWPEGTDPADPPFEPAEKFCPGCEEMARYARWRNEQRKDNESAFDGKRPYLQRREGH
jgi:hypothetical protein